MRTPHKASRDSRIKIALHRGADRQRQATAAPPCQGGPLTRPARAHDPAGGEEVVPEPTRSRGVDAAIRRRAGLRPAQTRRGRCVPLHHGGTAGGMPSHRGSQQPRRRRTHRLQGDRPASQHTCPRRNLGPAPQTVDRGAKSRRRTRPATQNRHVLLKDRWRHM